MKHLCVAAAFAACVSISSVVQAQDSATLYVACMTHYGDHDRANDVTPVAKVNWPSNQATLIQINNAYFKVMQQRGERFYKAQCWGGQDADRALSGLNQWEEMSGYAKRARREQALNDIFPAMFDEGYGSLSRMSSNVSRSSFSAIAVGSAIDGKENAAIERKRAKPATVESPSEKLEIAVPSGTSTHRMTNAEADAKYEAEMAEYRKTMAAHDAALKQHEQALADVEAQKARNAAKTSAAQSAYEAELAAAQAAQQAYREQYKQATGHDPEN
jgi:hypothetical protein